MKHAKLLVLSLLVFILAGCTDSNISLVKDGTLQGYEFTTIGKAFDAAFANGKWETFETDNGKRVVQFTGTISQAIHERYREVLMSEYDDSRTYGYTVGAAKQYAERFIKRGAFDQWIEQFSNEGYDNPERAAVAEVFEHWTYWRKGDPVMVQWTIHANGESFQTTYWESDSWKGRVKNFSLKDILDFIYG